MFQWPFDVKHAHFAVTWQSTKPFSLHFSTVGSIFWGRPGSCGGDHAMSIEPLPRWTSTPRVGVHGLMAGERRERGSKSTWGSRHGWGSWKLELETDDVKKPCHEQVHLPFNTPPTLDYGTCHLYHFVWKSLDFFLQECELQRCSSSGWYGPGAEVEDYFATLFTAMVTGPVQRRVTLRLTNSGGDQTVLMYGDFEGFSLS